jgi:carbonic anhydrase
MMRSAMVDEALEWLVAGNQRFVVGKRAYPDQTPAHRRELAASQHPFAAILG